MASAKPNDQARDGSRAARSGPSGPSSVSGSGHMTSVGNKDAMGSAPKPLNPGGSSHDRDAANTEVILKVDDRIRAAGDETELLHVIANETRTLVGARQVFVLRAGKRGQWRVAAVSSLALIERETPFVRWIESLAVGVSRDGRVGEGFEFSLPAYCQADDPEVKTYPFQNFYWQPLALSDGTAFAGLLLARERFWQKPDTALLSRQAGVYVSAWKALFGERSLRARPKRALRLGWVGAVAALGLSFVPVPMTALAPVEIVARDPHRVTAPLDGVVDDVLVQPNQLVRRDEPLLRYEDTTLRSRFEVADQDMKVARARFDRAQQAAFTDQDARHQLASLRHELDLKVIERSFAEAQLAQSVVRAKRDGVLIFNDRDDLVGRPIRIGENLMEIADPKQIAARVDLAVADAIVLEGGADVRLFLDADPLSSVSAKLVSVGYHAEANSTQQLTYKLNAALTDPAMTARIGSRGTAQLFGRTVPLIYFLLRRPIAAVRQYVGV
ncbi:MAG: HlyD family efflux transporter periplasmic adaptor subunit [Pseudomonadota bacterium]